MEKYSYIKMKEDGTIKYLPLNDPNGEIVGKNRHVMNLKEWMDENPEERKRLGWIKHIHHNVEELGFDHQTQYAQRYYKQIDEFTIEDEFIILDKAEEMMLLEEMLETVNYSDITIGGMPFEDFGG